MSDSKSILDAILKSVVNHDGQGSADTMLVSSHLSQMKMFGIRQGVEFYPAQDNFGTQRFDFIQQVIKFNKLDARLDAIWDRFLAYGKGLFYIRPTKKTYRLYWFDKNSYRTYYSPEATLREVMRCTRDDIRINTFMLDADGALRSFIEQLTAINKGRAFFTTPETLGEYVLVDFLEHKRSLRATGGRRRAS